VRNNGCFGDPNFPLNENSLIRIAGISIRLASRAASSFPNQPTVQNSEFPAPVVLTISMMNVKAN
jgi:hypothetical protein